MNIVLVGKFGSQVNQIAKRIEENFNYNYVKHVTTNPEANTDEYVIVDEKTYGDLVEQSQLVQSVKYKTYRYGIKRTDILDTENAIIVATPIGLEALYSEGASFVPIYVNTMPTLRYNLQAESGVPPLEVTLRKAIDDYLYDNIISRIYHQIIHYGNIDDSVTKILEILVECDTIPPLIELPEFSLDLTDEEFEDYITTYREETWNIIKKYRESLLEE